MNGNNIAKIVKKHPGVYDMWSFFAMYFSKVGPRQCCTSGLILLLPGSKRQMWYRHSKNVPHRYTYTIPFDVLYE